ncbi:MAG: NYN domain-containing protein [Hyphomicrobiaceae bacterium]
MKREHSGPFLSAVFVDYDNVYLSLRRKSEDAAKRFAKDAIGWLKQIENGALITSTNGLSPNVPRRIVMNRCYGNPVPRRNTSDNSTDMSSFPFVRHHFLRAGFEVVDCPPLTAQLKNSSDIRMVMDLRDYLSHETHFDEFIILSGDADFTPVLHRLRAHARRTVIYATEYTAAPYTAISDGEVREVDLIELLTRGRVGLEDHSGEGTAVAAAQLESTRRAIMDEVVTAVRTAHAPVPLEVLADRAVRTIGHDRTIGTGWGGAGGFRELLLQGLPQGLRLSGEPPYVVIDIQRHLAQPAMAAQRLESHPLPSRLDLGEAPVRAERLPAARDDLSEQRNFGGLGALRPTEPSPQQTAQGLAQQGVPQRDSAHQGSGHQRLGDPQGLAHQGQAPSQTGTMIARRPSYDQSQSAAGAPPAALKAEQQPQPTPQQVQQPSNINIQQSIARIHEACKAPPLAPPEYRMLFETIAKEITENGLIGAQTIQNITLRAQDRGIDVRRDDVRFVLEVISEADPWFEQGASANLFAGRFRNFVVARCRAQGLTLSADELDLVEAWFAAGGVPTASVRQPGAQSAPFSPTPQPRPTAPPPEAAYWSGSEESRQQAQDPRNLTVQPTGGEPGDHASDDFPRIVRTRLRG